MFVNKDRLRILIPRVFVVRPVQPDRRARKATKEIQVHAVQLEQPDRKVRKAILERVEQQVLKVLRGLQAHPEQTGMVGPLVQI